MPALPQLGHGSVFAGYWIDCVLDRGGMGVVYKAIDVDLDRGVALKLIAPEYMQDETAVARFKTESRLAASLEHPNIVPVHRGGEENGVMYLAMRFVPGTNLRKLIDRGPLPLDTTAEIVTQVADALDAAHARGLVHRDVKPANILISDETVHTHAYLTDFGLTKRPGSTGNLTRTGLWVGTPDYVAPEQIQGHVIDARTDIYSLGCVVYEMLTGRVAYAKEGDIAKLWAHISNPPPQPSAARPELLPVFDDVVARATAKDPAERYATAGAMAAAVREAVALQQGTQMGGVAPAMDVGAPGGSAGGLPGATIAASASSAAVPPPPPPSATVPASAASAPEPSPAGPSQPAAPPPPRAGGLLAGRRAAALGFVVILACAVVAVVLLSSGGTKPTPAATTTSARTQPAGQKLTSNLDPVPTNHVAGAGDVQLRLSGTVVTVTLSARGLVNNTHAMHIHAGARGECPPPSAARSHNGHLAISTLDGVPYYGPPVTALTTRNDTSKKSILAFNRFPTGSAIRYTRQIKVSKVVAANIRHNDAVVVIHGIDYDHDGTYGNVLDRSDLDRSLPGEITAPALCGPIVAAPSSTSTGPTKTSQLPSAGSGTLYTASLQAESATIASLCFLGRPGEGDRTPAWDA